jgi:4-alpha-glucanotransferase
MNLSLNLKFHSVWGQQIFVCGNLSELGNNKEENALPLQYENELFWSANFTTSVTESFAVDYYYFVLNQDGTKMYSALTHQITIEKNNIKTFDEWCGKHHTFTTFFTQPFTEIFNKQKNNSIAKEVSHIFKVKATQLNEYETLCIIGNVSKLGEWTTENPKLLKYNNGFYEAATQLPLTDEKIIYKYGVYNIKLKQFVKFEDGDNRFIIYTRKKQEQIIVQDSAVNLPLKAWKGSGVAIPVFSLKTKTSFGVGEFTDIKALATWCHKVGLKLIQLLPINDTIVNKTNTDSYPYAANSSFALHPLYINIKEVGSLPKDHKLETTYARKQRKLNNEEVFNYEQVIKYKLAYLKELFIADSSILTSDDFKDFFEKNEHWLKPFAAYSYLRDKYKTTDFSEWGKYATIDETQLKKFTQSTQKHYTEISFWYFVQYHLHIQLKAAVGYAHNLGIALKGDIPIGIGRTSCDAWQHPELFNMDKQAGAPPDDFAIKGQNWGFPTYNWQAMQANGFKWWKQRFEKMSDYFDAFRIDHILGFFRIWSIPLEAVEGIMGHFKPAIPVDIVEFAERGIPFSTERYCNPYITQEYLLNIFGELTVHIQELFFEQNNNGTYALKEAYATQKRIEQFFTENNEEADYGFDISIKYKLFDCCANVLLFADDEQPENKFHINIAMEKTYSFRQLNWHEQQQLRELSINYFYERQDEFWRIEALKKLPSIQHTTNMLICGEDLGMVPKCVPGVMNGLSMLSLEVQRMPKAVNTPFVNLNYVPYLSVATPSTHDMSTIRGWWEEDRSTTQNFYNNFLGHYGEAPLYCEPWVVKNMIAQHLYCPSMLSVFQLQDLMGMSSFRRINPDEERINVPSNPNHYWAYRMHIKLEDLLKEKDFNNELRELIVGSGR